jgi:hypothetical protein
MCDERAVWECPFPHIFVILEKIRSFPAGTTALEILSLSSLLSIPLLSGDKGTDQPYF